MSADKKSTDDTVTTECTAGTEIEDINRIPTGEAESDSEEQQEGNNSQRCCSCNYRRATIVLATVNSVGYGLLAGVLLAGSLLSVVLGATGDEENKWSERDALTGYVKAAARPGYFGIIFGVIFLFNVFKMVAAIKRNTIMLAIAIILDMIVFGFVSYLGKEFYSVYWPGYLILGIIYNGAVIYPTAGLFYNVIKRGTTNEDTYPEETDSYDCEVSV